MSNYGFNFGLSGLPFLGDECTRSISPENPTGEKGRGGMAVPVLNDPALPFASNAVDLGQGWKVNPFIRPMPQETVTIMDVDGPGVIQHIWMATDIDWKSHGRACILRFFWDGEEKPSIEVPMTDFFAVGHDTFAAINSAVIAVVPTATLNCYWPMPFRKHCKITFTNESGIQLPLLTYQITYTLTEVPENAGYLHAQWRRAVTDPKNPDYVILDGVKGHGRYVGTFLAWTQLSEGWFGEGEIKFFMDGDGQFPTICGTGTEDYFCSTYCFPQNYAMLYAGAIEHEHKKGPPKWSLYRWHIMDPICFREDLKVTIQALGWGPDRRYKMLQEDIASVAYWYQNEPHNAFPEFPHVSERWPRGQVVWTPLPQYWE